MYFNLRKFSDFDCMDISFGVFVKIVFIYVTYLVKYYKLELKNLKNSDVVS